MSISNTITRPGLDTPKATGVALRRTWLITGSSRGLGRALAEAALAAGENVIATARNPDQLQDLVKCYPSSARAVRLDVTDRAQAAAAGRGNDRRLRPAGRSRQQRRLCQRQRDRGLRGGRLPRPDRDQPLGRHQPHPGRGPRPPRPVLRPHRADLLGRRARHDPGTWPLSDSQVGCRGLLRSAPKGARSARDPRDADRARWRSHRLGRSLDARRRHPQRLPAHSRADRRVRGFRHPAQQPVQDRAGHPADHPGQRSPTAPAARLGYIHDRPGSRRGEDRLR